MRLSLGTNIEIFAKEGDGSMGERADKKHQTKPEVSMLVHEVIADIRRYHSITSNGETARRIVLAAFEEERVIERLAPYFWRDFVRGDYYWPGHHEPRSLEELLPDKWTRSKRLPIRFHQQEWRRLDNFAFALGRDRANTIAAILRIAIDDLQILRKVAPGYSFRSQYSLRKGVLP